MPRIPPIELEQTSAEARAAFEKGIARWGRLTNMKRTLLHSLPAYQVLMEWYTLFDGVKTFLDERLAIIFSHAISAESDCLICTTYMRRLLIDWGENPDELKLVEDWRKDSGKDVRAIHASKIFQAELKAIRDDKAVRGATPSTTKRAGGQVGDIASAAAKFKETGILPEDRELADAVVDSIAKQGNDRLPPWQR